jgi:hypothetical protein
MNKLINEFDEIIRWPKKLSVKKIVINWLSNKFKGGIKYSEKEVNEILDRHHSFNDIALLRRELISRKFLSRKNDGSKYWKTNK